MSENLKLQISVLIKNTIIILSYVVLGIIFNKWWIALFSIFFLSTINEGNLNKLQENTEDVLTDELDDELDFEIAETSNANLDNYRTREREKEKDD